LEKYNLDVIISVGYRVKSKRGTQFRQWATSILRDYLLKGHAINHRSDLEKHNAQYEPVNVSETDRFHDRFLIVDNDVYHIGASFKDLGKKLFAFSKMEITDAELMNAFEVRN
jgi:hypothetical protein